MFQKGMPVAIITNIAPTFVESREGATNKSSSLSREAEVQRKRARALGKQQQVAERIAAATGELSSGISQAASSAEQLKRAAALELR